MAVVFRLHKGKGWRWELSGRTYRKSKNKQWHALEVPFHRWCCYYSFRRTNCSCRRQRRLAFESKCKTDDIWTAECYGITKLFAIFIENYPKDIELTNDKRLILTYQHFDRQYFKYEEHFTRFCRLNPVETTKILYFIFKK